MTIKLTTQSLKTIMFGYVGRIDFQLAPTEIKLRKKDGEKLELLGIKKLYKVVDGWRTATVGGRYGDAVRSEEAMAGRDVQFQSLGLPNGRKFVAGSVAIMENTNKANGHIEYLALRQTGSDPSYYIDQSGKMWDKSEIEFALPAKSNNSRQKQENKVIWNTPKLENVRKLRLNGNEYKIVKG